MCTCNNMLSNELWWDSMDCRNKSNHDICQEEIEIVCERCNFTVRRPCDVCQICYFDHEEVHLKSKDGMCYDCGMHIPNDPDCCDECAYFDFYDSGGY